MMDWWFGFESEETVQRTISKEEEEEELWKGLEEIGLLPIEVEVIPEGAYFISFDENGNSLWKGISGKEYLVKK